MIRPKKQNIPKILKIKEYRNRGKLSFREIARAMKLDVKDVFRWYMYDEKKLSTRERLTVLGDKNILKR